MILDLDDMITRLAHLEDMLGKAQLCLIDLRRVLTFLSRPRALGSHIYDADIRELSEDVRSLVEHDAFLFQKVRFLLDTTSGFINTEQNDTIRRFSILPSMLAPPMLIASIYGMNTDVLPFAKGGTSFIVVSLILMAFLIGPLIYFRWKKWIWVHFKTRLFLIDLRNATYKKSTLGCFFLLKGLTLSHPVNDRLELPSSFFQVQL